MKIDLIIGSVITSYIKDYIKIIIIRFILNNRVVSKAATNGLFADKINGNSNKKLETEIPTQNIILWKLLQ